MRPSRENPDKTPALLAKITIVRTDEGPRLDFSDLKISRGALAHILIHAGEALHAESPCPGPLPVRKH